MSAKVRVGIIGMGIGQANAKAIAANPRGEVVALCDLVQTRMDKFAADLGQPVRFFTDYKAMCRDSQIDAVFIGSPNQLHVPMALEAIRHDKHVLVTKPLADSLAAAKKVVQAAESAGVINMMSLSTRFGPACQYLQKQVDSGVFGTLYYGRARSVRRAGIPAWNLGFIQKGGGAFRDMGVHVLDAIWALMGRPNPISVSGVSGARFGPRGQGYMGFATPAHDIPKQYASDDYAGGLIRFEDGVGVHVESFWASHQAPEFQLELFGEEAGAKMQPLTIYRTVDNAAQDITVDLPAGPSAWDRIAGHFIDCILDRKPCQAPLRDGMLVQEMMEAMLKSAETGREVRLGARR